MAPAERQYDAVIISGQRLVGAVTIALHDALVAGEQRLGVAGATTWCVVEHDGRRVLAAPGAVVARDRPGVALLGIVPTAWCADSWVLPLTTADVIRIS